MTNVTHLPPFKFNLIGAKDLYHKELPPIQYLVDDFIIKAGLTYIVGPPGSFKTGLMMLISIAGASKDNIINFNINKPFKTLFIDEENGIINTKDRFVHLVKGLQIDVDKEIKNEDIVFANISGFTFTPFNLNGLKELIEENKPDLIVIDNIARCIVGSERDEQDVARILGMIKPIIEAYGVAFVIIHHTRKGDAMDLNDISGSRDFGAQCDNAFIVKEFKKKSSVKHFVLKQVKSKFGLGMDAINFTVEGDDRLFVKYIGTATENIKYLAEEIKTILIDWIIDNPHETYKTTTLLDVMKSKGFNDTNIRNAIKMIVEDKILRFKQKGEYCFLGDKNE